MDWSLYVDDPAYEWVTTAEAVRRLREHLAVTQSTRYLRDSVKKGRLPGYEIDGVWYVDWLTLSERFAGAIRKATESA